MIQIKTGDITLEVVDAIVNAANTHLRGGGGVDGAIHKAAGPSILQECRKIGQCPTGSAVMTGAGKLGALKIIHAVGPVWRGGTGGEEELLRRCYRTCFKLALEAGLKTIAFPAISTGAYGYPKREAASVAVACGIEFDPFFDEIRFICFSNDDFLIYQEIYSDRMP